MKLIADIRIENGTLKFKQRSTVLSDIAQMKDGDYVMTIERRKKKRSLSQNAYYWGVVVPLVKEGLLDIGYRMTTDDTHEYLKGQFAITEVVNERTGEVLKSIGSTSEMTTSKMMDYFAEITQWAAEYLNVQIPNPGEQLKIEI
ncbi:MAG TPA: recombination protein NinB [Bacteroidales bacterium]|nr:recombination protein NinB [Bacteroidales bacterium]